LVYCFRKVVQVRERVLFQVVLRGLVVLESYSSHMYGQPDKGPPVVDIALLCHTRHNYAPSIIVCVRKAGHHHCQSRCWPSILVSHLDWADVGPQYVLIRVLQNHDHHCISPDFAIATCLTMGQLWYTARRRWLLARMPNGVSSRQKREELGREHENSMRATVCERARILQNGTERDEHNASQFSRVFEAKGANNRTSILGAL
jgi:hypothetical protein